jgi:hypothetical protein
LPSIAWEQHSAKSSLAEITGANSGILTVCSVSRARGEAGSPSQAQPEGLPSEHRLAGESPAPASAFAKNPGYRAAHDVP